MDLELYQIPAIVLSTVGLVVLIFTVFKSGLIQANKNTISTYKDELEVIKEKLNRIIEENGVIKKENRDLSSKVNQLIGENKVLKEALALRSPSFEQEFKSIVNTIKVMQENFVKHYEEDSRQFEEIKDLIKSK